MASQGDPGTDLMVVALKRMHIVWISLLSILTPVATAYTSYARSLSQVSNEFTLVRLESEQKFARKEDLRILTEKIDGIARDTQFIKGMLERLRKEN